MNVPKWLPRLTAVILLLAPQSGIGFAAETHLGGGGLASDGAYTGPTELAAASGSQCTSGHLVTIVVKDGRFGFAWNANDTALVRIGPGGKYSAMLQDSFVTADKRMQVLPRLDGFVDGKVMAGEYGTRWCKYSYRLERMN